MPSKSDQQPTIAELLSALETAVNAGDRERAAELEQTILQRLAAEAADRAAIERQVRDLIAELDNPKLELRRFKLDMLKQQERSAARDSEAYSILSYGHVGVDIKAEPDGEIYPVWFGTNRKPAGKSFGSERHDRVTLGRALVHVPEAHRFGEISSSFWDKLRRFDFRDGDLKLRKVEQRERDDFFAEINEAMQNARDSGETPHALFFLHGYNVGFEEAAIRAAQLGVDLKVPGATAFFSWPSRGSVAAYPADEACIEASEAAITEFLVEFAGRCGADKVHVIAHSMGNRGLLRALQRIAADAESRGKVKFGQIFLAAPDVDRDLFLNLARLYPEHAERATLYASSADKAVHLSAKVHDAPRAGYFTPYTVAAGVDTVAVPNFDVDMLGHSYYAQAEALLHDIYDLMRHGEAPARRQRIKPATDGNLSFWELKR